MLNKKIAAIVAASGMTVAGLALGITPAKAFDPVSNSYAIVGSDTLEDAVGALVNGTSVTGSGVRVTTSDSSTLASFDATGSGTIITKPYGIRFQRPNGSGDGRKALESVINNRTFTATGQAGIYASLSDSQFAAIHIDGQVDISRGSSGGTVDARGDLARYTFGRDAIAFAYGSSVTPGANGYISAADMKLLFQCDGTTMTTYHVTNVVIPQAGSGTRKDFLSKIGISSDGSIPAASLIENGGCVKTGQEHDASGLLAGEVMPMSASRWIAMTNGVSYKRIAAGVKLGSLVSGTQSVGFSNSYSATATNGSTTLTLAASNAFVAAGQTVIATNIPAGTVVSSVSGTAVTLSASTTGAVSGPVTFIDSAPTSAQSGASGAVAVPVVAYYKDTTWGRDTYLFVDKRRVDPTNGAYDAVLAALFDYTNETSLTYQGPNTGANAATAYSAMTTTPVFGAYTSAAVKLKYGFLPASVEEKQIAYEVQNF